MSNQPFYLTHNGIEYKRLNWRMWFVGSQRVNDIGLVTQLEKAYSDVQRASAKGPRGPVGIPPGGAEPRIERKGLMTPREKRGNGRVE